MRTRRNFANVQLVPVSAPLFKARTGPGARDMKACTPGRPLVFAKSCQDKKEVERVRQNGAGRERNAAASRGTRQQYWPMRMPYVVVKTLWRGLREGGTRRPGLLEECRSLSPQKPLLPRSNNFELHIPKCPLRDAKLQSMFRFCNEKRPQNFHCMNLDVSVTQGLKKKCFLVLLASLPSFFRFLFRSNCGSIRFQPLENQA